MKRYILAVSGGVDSVVLLHMAQQWPDAELVVAHFDHGIRKESARDAMFVKTLAAKYKLPFVSERQELGEAASEEKARQARYNFLRRTAEEQRAQIVTAHHGDDVIETIVINVLRGTGWRGLSSLRSAEVVRPLLAMTKQDIIDHAKTHKLMWREDATNDDLAYLRNYVRHKIVPRLGTLGRAKLLSLYKEQVELHEAIHSEIWPLLRHAQVAPGEYQRHVFIMADAKTAYELLYGAIYKTTSKTTTRPQLKAALLAVKTFQPGTRYQVGQGVELRFSRANFIVEEARN